MRLLGDLARRVSMLVRRGRFDRDLAREMRFHLEMQAAENRDNGMPDRDALDAARRQFGNETLLHETSREAWGWTPLERLAQDVRHAGRALRKDRLFTLVAVLVLALGIGGNTAVFSLVNALLLNPFPYPHADRLVEIVSRTKGGSWYSTVPLSDFGAWRDRSRSFEAVAAYGWTRSSLTGQSLPGFAGPERVMTGTATADFLRVLGIRPAVGRFFTTAEDLPGGPPVVVLGYGTWMRRFGGRADIIGQTLTLSGKVRTIIGVMPPGLRLPGTFTCEVWLPAGYDIARDMLPGYSTNYDGDSVVGRLKPSVPLERASAEIRVISARLAEQLGRPPRNVESRAVRWGSDLVQSQGEGLRLLAVIVGTVLLLACANLAGLLLARGGSRSKEMAVRASLGAGRLRLIRYALTETLLLALSGGVLGLLLAAWTISLIGSAAPAYLGLDSALRIDSTVLAFTLGLTIVTGLAFGLLPAIQVSKAEVTTVLKGTSARGGGRRGGRILSALVVAEVALALLLLVSGGLMAKSFLRLLAVDPGIQPNGLLTFRIGLSGQKYESKEASAQLFATLLERLRRLPSVTSVGGANPLPMSREYSGGGFQIEGRPAPRNWRDMSAQYCYATPQYFRTMGIPVLTGREFENRDDFTESVVVNSALVKQFFPNENPLGHRIVGGGTIVGVVGNVRHNGLGREPNPQIYLSFARHPVQSLSIVVRTTGDPRNLIPLVRQQVRSLDPDLPIDRLKPMTDTIGESLADVRLVSALVGGFAVFALVLAAIGMYGVIAYSVSQRQQEIGIRMALGASRRSVLTLVLSRGALLTAVGILLAIPLALAAVRLTASFLYGISPRDPTVFVAIPLLLCAVAFVASYLPARHATRIDPLEALRTQ